MSNNDPVLGQILAQLNSLQVSQQTLQAKVCICTVRPTDSCVICVQLDALTGIPTSPPRNAIPIPGRQDSPTSQNPLLLSPTSLGRNPIVSSPPSGTRELTNIDKEREKALYPGRVLLTSKSVTIILPLLSLALCKWEGLRMCFLACSGTYPAVAIIILTAHPSYVHKHDTQEASYKHR